MSPDERNDLRSIRFYYVDEAGDGVLFNRKGGIALGKPGCQKYFILGLLDVADPVHLKEETNSLRKTIVSDPYFRTVPSMQPEAKKTSLFFHAKDDLPEVRRDYFSLLRNQEVRFFAVVKTMSEVLEYVKRRNRANEEYRYHPDELYDHTVRRLFKQRLHLDREYYICFSRRGKADRTRRLAESIEATRTRFLMEKGIGEDPHIAVRTASSWEYSGLQAVDYFLWALQRHYERCESRYLEFLWSRVSLIHDVDDVTHNQWGVYYSKQNPIPSLKRGPRI